MHHGRLGKNGFIGPRYPKYGYARVSTGGQNPALQLVALKKAGCKTLFKDEGVSGTTTKRPSLLRCLKTLERGDTVIVWKLDRLGRGLRGLITMLDDLKHRGVKFRPLTACPYGCIESLEQVQRQRKVGGSATPHA